ncbi:nuclease-related domain-containing protein [Pseudomonas aeruginosa]|uniref:nuclease-related domain-containing protein n=1 Tax=Pseudomonas aeruginosa TaxID=287 RepID=UPI002E2E2BF4|nr:nuclease-related domain-containing protein [Pseudomonas aeruginosa]
MNHFLWLYLPPVIGLIAVAAICHYLLLNRPAYRGWWGEYKVNFMLRLCLSGEYHVLTNALYRGQLPGETTQIDHIVVSRYGLFVLETKCFKGKIITDPTEPELWIQIVRRRKYKLQSPLIQNYAHVKALQKVTGIHSQQIHSFAVMAGSASFPYGMPEGVFGIWGVVRMIQSFRTPVFTPGHVGSLLKGLERRRMKGGYWAAKRHADRLNSKHQQSNSSGLGTSRGTSQVERPEAPRELGL